MHFHTTWTTVTSTVLRYILRIRKIAYTFYVYILNKPQRKKSKSVFAIVKWYVKHKFWQVRACDLPPRRCILICSSVSFLNTVIFGFFSSVICNKDFTIFEVAKPLHALIPSAHVWPNFLSPISPQSLNQAPPWAQQLRLPDLVKVPHFMHLLLLLLLAPPIGDVLTVMSGSIWMCTRT